MAFEVKGKIEEDNKVIPIEKSSVKGYMDKNTYIAKIDQFTCEVVQINYLEMFHFDYSTL